LEVGRQSPSYDGLARRFQQAFEEFKKFCRAPSARLVKKADAKALRDALLSRGEHSATTIAKLPGFLRADFQHLVDDGDLEVNPFSGVKVSTDGPASTDGLRMPFETSELNAIFAGPVYWPGFRPPCGPTSRPSRPNGKSRRVHSTFKTRDGRQPPEASHLDNY
jgi:hypothetical protein